jgi:hypothetical protein
MYLPKPAYWQIQEELTRTLTDIIYRLSPQSQPDKCLGTFDKGTSGGVQLYTGTCNNTNQQWNKTWLGDGNYRFSPLSASYIVLSMHTIQQHPLVECKHMIGRVISIKNEFLVLREVIYSV